MGGGQWLDSGLSSFGSPGLRGGEGVVEGSKQHEAGSASVQESGFKAYLGDSEDLWTYGPCYNLLKVYLRGVNSYISSLQVDKSPISLLSEMGNL